MKGEKIIDTGFVIIKESYEIGSPISTLFYERYNDIRELNKQLKQKQNKIQCIISNNIVENSTKFGSSQSPSIGDYADKINTMDFLLKLS
jgi:thymidylate synthase ThyX